MAETNAQRGVLKQTGAVIAAVYRAIVRDGTVDAFLRQGTKELAEAFGQMTPDSISVNEPGAVFNPLYSDIAADKRERLYGAESKLPLLKEILGNHQPSQTGQERGQDKGQEMGREM
jgi:hypothetical protein